MMDIIYIALVFGSLILMVYLLLKLFRRSRGSGAGMFMISQGAMDAFLDPDKKKATEVIVERNAGKKMEEQSAEGKKPPENGAEKESR